MLYFDDLDVSVGGALRVLSRITVAVDELYAPPTRHHYFVVCYYSVYKVQCGAALVALFRSSSRRAVPFR